MFLFTKVHMNIYRVRYGFALNFVDVKILCICLEKDDIT
jgi:hypothetical protein